MGAQRTAPILLLILVSSAISITEINVAEADSRTLVVPDDHPTIASAIGNATDGDVIFVKKGTYDGPMNQTLVIAQSISLMGEDPENTTINLYPSWGLQGWEMMTPIYGYDSPISIKADNVHISGFTIRTVGGFLFVDVNGVGSEITENYLETGLALLKDSQKVIGNIVKGNILCDTHNHTIANNILGGNIYSLASGVTIEGNLISDEECAIGIGGYGNTIFNNTIENCDYGLSFWDSAANNLIYHNNFINNRVQVQHKTENPSLGQWDNGYTLGGNYWSDYNGTDADGDGIGDTPYIIDENNQDNYPLMNPVAIIPEFPSWAILPLVLIITLFSVVVKRKLTRSS